MILRVGPFLYRVHFRDEPLMHEGERCLGLCDNETHEIFVATQTSFTQQVQVICHEYMEAWLYHFGGSTRDGDARQRKEAYCDLFGLAMAQFVMDLVRQLDQFSEASSMCRSPDASAISRDPPTAGQDEPREVIATKLADAAARAGLSVRRMNPAVQQPGA